MRKLYPPSVIQFPLLHFHHGVEESLMAQNTVAEREGNMVLGLINGLAFSLAVYAGVWLLLQ